MDSKTHKKAHLDGWSRGWDAALAAAIEDALPATAENPNEDAYQRGRFDGIMEYQKALRELAKD